MATIPEKSFNCVVTSPPYYWQRDYNVPGQLGLEPTPDAYVAAIADAMDEVRRLLRKDGLLFLNLGDTYYSKKGKPKGRDKKNWARRFGRLRAVDTSGLGLPRKTAIGIPWQVALCMISRGWTLRSPIIWKREHAQPEPTARDRPWRSYEMMFMFSRNPVYYFSRAALQGEEDIWTVHSQSKHTDKLRSAYFPEQLVRRCLEIGCPPHGEVLDPFAGSGTVLRAAVAAGRPATGIDLSDSYCKFMAGDLKKL
ncbi:MAG: site-specific DNA-methyltransferase [Patescibacteria group bacterium]